MPPTSSRPPGGSTGAREPRAASPCRAFSKSPDLARFVCLAFARRRRRRARLCDALVVAQFNQPRLPGPEVDYALITLFLCLYLQHISARLQHRNRLELAARPYRAPRLVTDAPERLALPPGTAGKAKTDVGGGEFQDQR